MISGNERTQSKGAFYSIPRSGDTSVHALQFQFNPTTIRERRSVNYHLSEGQGQVLPLAQFGMVDPTVIEFQLFMYHNKGLQENVKSLRQLCLPRKLTNLTYYDQVSPNVYNLSLSDYGTFTGVVNSVEITTQSYHKVTMAPTQLTADISFTVISRGIYGDVTHLKQMGV